MPSLPSWFFGVSTVKSVRIGSKFTAMAAEAGLLMSTMGPVSKMQHPGYLGMVKGTHGKLDHKFPESRRVEEQLLFKSPCPEGKPIDSLRCMWPLEKPAPVIGIIHVISHGY